MTKTFEDFIPPFVVWDHAQFNDPLTSADALYILQHEIDLFEEGQDGALSETEISMLRRARAELRKVTA